MSDLYYKELRRVMQNDKPALPTSKTRSEIERAIVDVSDQLRGPLSNADRLCLIESRHELRKQLAMVSA